jgi:hypothetical protein
LGQQQMAVHYGRSSEKAGHREQPTSQQDAMRLKTFRVEMPLLEHKNAFTTQHQV